MCEFLLMTYGSLMRKQMNHRFCRRAKSIEEVIVCGKLYQLSPGFPALQVPVESILDRRTGDVFTDAQNQYEENDHGDFEFKIYDGWGIVYGELMTFSDPEESIPPIDKLESVPFWYDRVLVPAKKADGTVVAAFVYTMTDIHFTARYLPDGVWPENRKVKFIINPN